eukprot:gnl/MRDRNA2_/MRDRNA2_83540_c1_seq2.p1 gnl/MRDRNA2_/MRDRNA2_83540_c1~~gnl/MRDRNA2_/MRDRNA2_83540_c1_seq2.p1  ORF type:complete len:220 (+),score=37.51 gnl/MRDRNA2_/MRDRNA2_83540_c1_seq2:85-744(+)
MQTLQPSRIKLLIGVSGSGKTTSLDLWRQRLRSHGKRVRGVLCPESKDTGRRIFLFLSSGKELTLQLNDGKPCPECTGQCKDTVASPEAYGGQRILSVGNFVFSAEAFDDAEAEILGINTTELGHGQKRMKMDAVGSEWVFVDEIGPLEVRKEKGLHKAMLGLLARWRSCADAGQHEAQDEICVIVRPNLRAEFLNKYGLKEDEVQDISPQELQAECRL